MLATDSALWPSPRLRKSVHASAVVESAVGHRHHDDAEARRDDRRRLAETEAVETPAGRKAEKAPKQRRPEIHRGEIGASELRERSPSSCSVTSPSPCVRPGSVASIITAATTTVVHAATSILTHRGRDRVVGRFQRRSLEVDVALAVLGVFLAKPAMELFVVRVRDDRRRRSRHCNSDKVAAADRRSGSRRNSAA